MKKSDAAGGNISLGECLYRRVLELLESKWSVLVLHALDGGRQRYRQIEARIQDITQKMLTQTLRRLERDGLIRRIVHPTVPPAVEYELTDLGRSLMPHIRGFRTWAAEHFAEVVAARAEYDRKHGQRDAAE
ncbi:MAG: transcriptional regulator [Thermobacillus sp.]|uniref:winged helix-turn-helix transcriptional regulator n=1 Tax=Thermobacillus sp. TaxID=2108467 RepID=UPI000E36FEBB|nr:helix-turn-helix domain-containing protein [Thermobacillus sp.]REK56724.1 MAG: transcriptional regulator [Thermobacillus sp.]